MFGALAVIAALITDKDDGRISKALGGCCLWLLLVLATVAALITLAAASLTGDSITRYKLPALRAASWRLSAQLLEYGQPASVKAVATVACPHRSLA